MSNDQCIGVVCPFIWRSYFNRLLSGIKALARQGGFQVIAIQASPQDVYEHRIGADRAKGWIAVVDATGTGDLIRDGQHVVTVSALAPEVPCANVLPDNYGGALTAVR